jgi:hypothetical protein
LRICPSWPRSRLRLSPILAYPYEHSSCCHAQPGSLLFITPAQVSHLVPLLSGWLLTNVQVNIITTLHKSWNTCMYIHYISIIVYSFFFFTHLPFSWAGWLCLNHTVRYKIVKQKKRRQWAGKVEEKKPSNLLYILENYIIFIFLKSDFAHFYHSTLCPIRRLLYSTLFPIDNF